MLPHDFGLAHRTLANRHAADRTKIGIHVGLRRINYHAAPRTKATMIGFWFIPTFRCALAQCRAPPFPFESHSRA